MLGKFPSLLANCSLLLVWQFSDDCISLDNRANMSVHYKFKNSLESNTVVFDGVHISVGDLKKAIMQQKKLGKNADYDFQITDTETKRGKNE